MPEQCVFSLSPLFKHTQSTQTGYSFQLIVVDLVRNALPQPIPSASEDKLRIKQEEATEPSAIARR